MEALGAAHRSQSAQSHHCSSLPGRALPRALGSPTYTHLRKTDKKIFPTVSKEQNPLRKKQTLILYSQTTLFLPKCAARGWVLTYGLAAEGSDVRQDYARGISLNYL